MSASPTARRAPRGRRLRHRDSRARAQLNLERYGTIDERKVRVLDAIDLLGITPLATIAARAGLPENMAGAMLGLLVDDRKVVRHGRRGWERR